VDFRGDGAQHILEAMNVLLIQTGGAP